MKNILTILCVVIPIIQAYSQSPLKVCTFNIKYENPKEGIHQWDNRKQHIIDFIKVEKLDVVGMQEVLHSQVVHLNDKLPNYKMVGVGREDGEKKGEYVPIYYRSDRFMLLETNTFWLSETPSEPSKAWDAALPRICTYAKLKQMQTEEIVHIYNVHYDHVGAEARKESTKLVLDSILSQDKNARIILMGDFNLEEDKEPYQLITNSLADSYKSAELKFGITATFNGFNMTKIPSRRIDYVFIRNLSAVNYKTNSSVIDGTYLSDHFPVVTELNY